MPTDLPNLLTISRIAAIPVLVVFAAVGQPWGDLAACLVFSAAGITDYFDGKIARERMSRAPSSAISGTRAKTASAAPRE